MTLSSKQQQALQQFRESGTLHGVHHNTVRSLERRGLLDANPEPVNELIGRAQSYSFRWIDRHDLYQTTPTKDARRGDYAFWDALRKGCAQGYEMAGVFLKPLENKLSGWTFGAVPKFDSDNPEAAAKVSAWWAKNQSAIMRTLRESIGLGDCYLVFNGDATLTVVPPHVVDPIVDPNDFSQIIGYRVTETYSNNAYVSRSTMTVQDEYYADYRIRRTIERNRKTERRFPNPLGRIPVLHLKNNASPDELYGRTEGEGLLKVLEAYDDVIRAGISGNLRQGRPTPVINGVSDEAAESIYDSAAINETYYDADNVQQKRKVVYFDSDQLVMTSGSFGYAQPGAFIGETERLLGLLFYLILQHTEIPEFIWGNAIASSKASAESQMPAFAQFIETRQNNLMAFVTALAELVVTWHALFEVGVNADDAITVKFPPLTGQDGKLTLDAIKLGREQQLLDKETALRLMPLDVDDPRAVLNAMEDELDREEARFDARMTAQAARDFGFEEPEVQDGATAGATPEPRVSESIESFVEERIA